MGLPTAPGTSSAPRSTPLAVDELLASQKRARDEAARPKFRTKAERERDAAEAKRREAEAAQQREAEAQRQREEHARKLSSLSAPSSHPERPTAPAPAPPYDPRDRDRDRGGYRGRGRGGGIGSSRFDDRGRRDDDRDRGRYDDRGRDGRNGRGRDDGPPPSKRPNTGPGFVAAASDVGRHPSASSQPPASAPATNGNGTAEALPELDTAELKARYLGVPVGRKVARKQSDKKFTFDWDQEEDTSSSAFAAPAASIAKPVIRPTPALADGYADALSQLADVAATMNLSPVRRPV